MITTLLDLDLLRTFLLAVDLRSFAKAADQVSRTQSAVSLQMQRLEEITGHVLFVKQGRGWQLTPSGDLLLGYARQLLEINDQAIQALTATHISGRMRLGMLTDFSEGGLPLVLARFAGAHPQVQVEITIDRHAALVQKLQSGKLDVVVTFGMEMPEEAIPVGRLPLHWIGNSNKAVAQQTPLPLLLFEAPCLFRAAAQEALEKAKRNWRPVLTISSVTGMWSAAGAGLGIAVRTGMGLPESCIVLPASAGLPPLPAVKVFMLARQKSPTPAVKQLTEILHDTLKEQLIAIRRKYK
ncbi:MAG TPA: LysR substrate-binding domain-containing protein [Chitinophaga sp.]|uniref:LysR substrate-binding domain-containing protein n=1 Tax=Chitinophaga sp. TaxID=1869181 RepID=UPI002CD14F34|nr:LysR substrate-binding domain-containing protein [Chitinophaga sp.]HVI44211.1 LysR substrate-binding domain-containing protein [Chitinophaga sp.]